MYRVRRHHSHKYYDSSRYDEHETNSYGAPIPSRHDEYEEFVPKHHHFSHKISNTDIDKEVEDKARQV